ncbi:hypothetical protein M23134_03655 [Microscilla marina ATCC 23134]|uniref:Uncharacterized protein n=1 Tax=Microscilla marina ATCC 23134 TaxID=313606 RepID=A1ZZB7_MICM2|nr:hypothetical protein M23134_03655 [Microscilla marina ATCC 23134]
MFKISVEIEGVYSTEALFAGVAIATAKTDGCSPAAPSSAKG